jgi:transposase-like protein
MANSSRSAEKAEFWRLVLDEHRNSGMSIKAFCAQQGVSEPAFYAWRRKLQSRGASSDPPGKLVPVTVVDDHRPELRDPSQVQIVTPAGFVLRVSASLPTSELTLLLRSIEAASLDGAT